MLLPGPTTPIPSSWIDYFIIKSVRDSLVAAGVPAESDMIHVGEAITTQALSGPLTTVMAIRIQDALGSTLQQSSSLCIHVLGASIEEIAKTEAGWEEVLHCLPGVNALKIVHVGPEVIIQGLPMNDGVNSIRTLPMPCCPHCVSSGVRSRTEVYARGLWHRLRPALPPADLFVALNCGIHDHVYANSWAETIRSLPGPLLLTSYTKHEMEMDSIVLKQNGWHIQSAGANPFASTIAQSDPTLIEGVFTDNAFYIYATRN